MNIRDQIVQKRRERIASEGYTFGHPVPATRTAPLVEFCRQPLLICEIKRKSPSRGTLSANLDPVTQADLYVDQGCRSVSVLTEEDHFGGSLADLMAVKTAFPELAVLRKDFLIDRADVDIAFRAGADAILLIASMLDSATLADLYAYANSLGLCVLVEVHSVAEIAKVRPIQPVLMGINSRDLESFEIDLLLPPTLKADIDWLCTVVYESGLFSYGDALFARRAGFGGILVGEAVVRDPSRVSALGQGLSFQNIGITDRYFWNVLARHPRRTKIPLVKICGLCHQADALAAIAMGAAILGFVFAESKRRASPALIEALADVPIPKVAVVVARKATDDPAQAATLPADLIPLLERGLIDALQFSGDESPSDCIALADPFGIAWYKALRPQNPLDLQSKADYRAPRSLLDAWSASSYGGSGHQASAEIIRAWQGPLWLAGGLNANNIQKMLKEYQPELVDLASGIESAPGTKDHQAMQRFFKELGYE